MRKERGCVRVYCLVEEAVEEECSGQMSATPQWVSHPKKYYQRKEILVRLQKERCNKIIIIFIISHITGRKKWKNNSMPWRYG
mmetsp:Transcript_73293/g.205846  ORF Transcript_73293/g.205846 Transcript_73293/m.205846 type:complete len:83 (+) Transcript_73293:134-382(+)